MDRPTSTAAVSLTSLDDASTSGWDAHAIWQERVRNPHLGVASRRTPASIVLEEGSSGWDPLETWRLRIQRPRERRR